MVAPRFEPGTSRDLMRYYGYVVSRIITVGPLTHNLPFIGDRMAANSDTYGWFVLEIEVR
jgi:hypothetical protein